MDVTLINVTPFAREMLIFTKRTRLNMTPGLWAETLNMSEEEKLKELEYMANTIPSSWEFVDYHFLIEGVSRAFTHQFVRTRTNSYAQQSMRVTNMDGFDYVTGPSIDDDDKTRMYEQSMEHINIYYNELLMRGVKEEDARGVLPTNICTNIVTKINLRTMSDMARSRTGGRTQDEYQDVLKEMLDEVLKIHPWAHLFLFPKGRDFFDEIEEYARAWDGVHLLKIIDKMRKRL